MLPRTRPLGGRLGLEVDADLPDVFVDADHLVQALVALLDNALDATGAPARVTLQVQCESAAFVRFNVHDDGPGVRPENLGCIFDPFFTTKPECCGLGLSIAQQLVTENGGRIEVVSSPGGPTIFSVLVPVEARRR